MQDVQNGRQQGRSERKPESYRVVGTSQGLSDARTPSATIFNIL